MKIFEIKTTLANFEKNTTHVHFLNKNGTRKFLNEKRRPFISWPLLAIVENAIKARMEMLF